VAGQQLEEDEKFKEKQKDVVLEARQGGRSLSPAVSAACGFVALLLLVPSCLFSFPFFFFKENNFKIPKPGEGDCLSGQGRPIL
jgi:hypothetical protein